MALGADDVGRDGGGAAQDELVEGDGCQMSGAHERRVVATEVARRKAIADEKRERLVATAKRDPELTLAILCERFQVAKSTAQRWLAEAGISRKASE